MRTRAATAAHPLEPNARLLFALGHLPCRMNHLSTVTHVNPGGSATGACATGQEGGEPGAKVRLPDDPAQPLPFSHVWRCSLAFQTYQVAWPLPAAPLTWGDRPGAPVSGPKLPRLHPADRRGATALHVPGHRPGELVGLGCLRGFL